MGTRVTKRHNQDGSITKTTTYTHKSVFGKTKSESYSKRIPPKGSSKRKGLPWWVWAIIVLIIIGVFIKK